MKIIHRYVLREFAESFLFGLIVFSSILLIDQIFQLVDLLLSKGIPAWTVLRLFLLAFPNILSMAVPMAVLFGILLAYGRLSEDNEITSFRSAGLGYSSFTGPVLGFVLALSVFLVYFNQNLSPGTYREFRDIYRDVLTKNPLIKFEEKAVTNLGDYRIYVENVEEDHLRGVNIFKFAPEEVGMPWRISASSAVVSVNPDSVIFSLSNGFWQKPNPAVPRNLVHLSFESYRFSIPLGGPSMPVNQSLREMSGSELLAQIDDYRAKQLPTNFLETEYWLRWSLALAPLALAVAGIPLGVVLERGGRAIGFGISLLVIFGYYLLLVTGINLGEKGYARPALILFLPDAVTFIVGLFLWRKMRSK